MKTFIKLFLAFTLFSFDCFSQLTFQKSYTIPGGAAGTSGIITNDGGYIIAGLTYSFGAGNDDIYLIKTDSMGIPQWTKTYGTAVDDYAYVVYQTFDGGYVLGCDTYTSLGNDDFLLIKIDSIGNLIWSKKYDNGNESDVFENVIQTSDSGFIMIGSTHHVTPCCRNDLYLIKTDINGNILWNKTYHGIDGYEAGNAVQQTSDGNYIVTGSKDNTGAGPYYIWLIKIDAAGNKLWERTFGSGFGNSVKQTMDGGFVIAGLGNVGYANIILVKTDSLGDVQWEKIFQRNSTIDMANVVEQTPDSGFIITGQTGNLGVNDIFLFKTDANGDTVWTKFFGGIADDIAYSVQLTNDKGYAVFGYTNNFPPVSRSVYLIKTDSLGNSGCNEKNIVFTDTTTFAFAIPVSSVTSIAAAITTPTFLIDSGGVAISLCFSVGQSEISNKCNIKNIFPNPTTGKITITFTDFVKNGSVTIYNLLGERVIEEVLSATTKKEINLKDNPPGIYFVMLFDGDKYYCKKLIIEQN